MKTRTNTGSVSRRATRAVESFANASSCIGPVTEGMSIFAVTRGQFSMIDAILHVLDEVKHADRLSLWTWTVAEYEVQCLTRLRCDKRIDEGLLVIDGGARAKNRGLIREWQGTFGPESVRYVLNHAKIATVEGNGLKVLIRGSCNLNFNPRFEQLDLSEGGEPFALVREIEAELPILADDCGGEQVYEASRVSNAFTPEQLQIFGGLQTWRPK